MLTSQRKLRCTVQLSGAWLELKRLTFHWSVSDRSQRLVAVKTSENAVPTDKRSKVKHGKWPVSV